MAGGYNKELDIHYDEEYQEGNTKIYIVAPKITPEENERRKKELDEVASRIYENMLRRGDI